MNEFKTVIKNYRFLALWFSQILSQLTVNILSFIILIHLFNETGSSIASSLLWVAYAVPAIIVGPIAASFVDLTEKRRVLMIANLLQAVVVILYAILLYKKLLYLSYTVVFMYSLFNQFYVPAEAAILPLLMTDKELAAANGLFFITQQSSLILGFVLAGILNETLGFRPTLILVSFCLIAASISVSFLPKKQPGLKLPTNFEKRFSSFFEQIIEGYNFIKNTQRVLWPFLILLGVQVIMAVILVNLPRLATDILGISAGSSGITIVLPAGIGAIVGTFLIPKLINTGIGKLNLILGSFLVLGFCILAASSLGTVPSMIRIPTAVVVFVLTGLGVVGTLVPSITILQQETPKELLGRVFGNFWFLTTLATVVPVLFSATVTDLLGIQFLFILLSLICFGILTISVIRRESLI